MAVTAAIQLGWLGTTGPGRGGAALRPGHPLLPRRAAGDRRGDAAHRRHAGRARVRAPPAAAGASVVVERLAEEGFLAGVALADLVGDDGDGSVGADDAAHGLLVAVTERRTRAEIDAFVAALDKAVRSMTAAAGRRAGRRPGRQRTAARPRHRADPLRAVAARAGASWQLRTTGVPEWARRGAGPRRPPPRRAACRWPRCPSATWSAHFTRLSHRQFSVDLGAYPLGSCTMKYNPKVCDAVAGAARAGRRPPGRAGRADPGLAGRCWSSWKRRCARSPAWPRPPCSRRPGRPAS